MAVYICTPFCPGGGIGRRAGLKHQFFRECRFDPDPGYFLKHNLLVLLLFLQPMQIQLIKELVGHREPIYQLLPFSEYEFISASGDGVVAKWNIKNHSSVALAKCKSGVYALSKIEEKYLAIGTNSGSLHILKVKENKIEHSLKLSSKQIFSIQYSHKHELLFVGDGEGQVTSLNTQDFSISKQSSISKNSLRTISINPNENLIAFGTSENNIAIYSLPDFTLISQLTNSKNSVFCSQFISQTQLISGGRDAHLRLWDVVDKKEIKSIPAHFFTINDIAITAKYLVTASRDKSFKIWRKNDLELLKVVSSEKYLTVFKHSLNTVICIDDYIICGGDDRKILLWQIDVE